MHVSSALDAIKKRGTFKAKKKQRSKRKPLWPFLRLPLARARKLPRRLPGISLRRNPLRRRRLPRRPRNAQLWRKHQPQNFATSTRPYRTRPPSQKETAKNKRKTAATEMFQFYVSLLSLDAKYPWNKIVQEQMEANPFKDLQGMSRKGPRGLLHESFNKCVMFHLLTVFPNNAAEQEKYYLSNMLKKPQRVGILCQFIQRIEQLNAYAAQLPCWYYSTSYVASMTPSNVPFTEADLASHVLRMCPHQWQDQYNLQEKGMTLMDMHSLQASLEAIKCICTHEKTHAPSGKKASHKNKAGAKQPSNGATKQAHKKGLTKRTLCGIVLFKLTTFFSHVFAWP